MLTYPRRGLSGRERHEERRENLQQLSAVAYQNERGICGKKGVEWERERESK